MNKLEDKLVASIKPNPRGLEAYIRSAASLKALGRGTDLVVSFIESAPLVAREIGEQAVSELLSTAIKMYSKTSAGVLALLFSIAPTAAARLGELELFKGYLTLLDNLLAQAPRAIRPMLGKLDVLLGHLTLGGLRRWAMWGVSAHRADFGAQAAYIGLELASQAEGMNIPYNPRTDSPASPYRDDNRHLWQTREINDADRILLPAVTEQRKPLVRRLKHLIEAMQPQGMIRQRKVEDGDEIDLNAAISSLVELARQGVHTFCLTLDPYADQYVSRIFGAKNYLVLDHVARLPEKLPALYMGLTRWPQTVPCLVHRRRP